MTHTIRSTARLAVVLLTSVLVTLALLPLGTAGALPLTSSPRVLLLGDSLTWQMCTGAAQQVGSDAPRWLRERDGGCYGFSGATTSDMAFMTQGGRFYSPDPGQPHPYFPDRGMSDVWNLREAMSRADVLVIGLGTNDANRRTGCGAATQTPWPIQISRPASDGGDRVPCQLTDAEFRAHLDFFVWLAQGKPVFWLDIAVTNPADPAYAHQDEINAEIWAAARRHLNFRPIPWERAVASHPEYLRADGVHLTDTGRAARLRLVTDALYGSGYR